VAQTTVLIGVNLCLIEGYLKKTEAKMEKKARIMKKTGEKE